MGHLTLMGLVFLFASSFQALAADAQGVKWTKRISASVKHKHQSICYQMAVDSIERQKAQLSKQCETEGGVLSCGIKGALSDPTSYFGEETELDSTLEPMMVEFYRCTSTTICTCKDPLSSADEEERDEVVPWKKTVIDYGAANLYSEKARAFAEARLEKQFSSLNGECALDSGVFSRKIVSAKYNRCCINTPSSRPCIRESSYPYPQDRGACTAKLTAEVICGLVE